MRKIFIYITLLSLMACEFEKREELSKDNTSQEINSKAPDEVRDTIEVVNATFLGNEKRNYYGSQAPDSLHLIWTHFLGKGFTVVNPKDGKVEWRGAGWTGQPLMVREKDDYFLIQGAYDHHLKKINALTAELVWEYKFDNVIKGTGTLWKNLKADLPENSLVILQGSRKNIDKGLSAKHIFSFRAISYFTGKELWRLPIKRGKSYSRDVDASCLIINNKGYIPTENGFLTIFDPHQLDTVIVDGNFYHQPKILKEIKLYEKNDHLTHGGNLVPESSPIVLGGMLYVASGSGHVYGIDLKTDTVSWRFDLGADLNGTPAITKDSCLLIPIEKQYISGMGGVVKVNPRKDEALCVEWFCPTTNKGYAAWKGGVVGSVITFSPKNGNGEWMAFHGLDGYLYVNKTVELSDKKVDDAQKKGKCFTPKRVAKIKTSPSISTPIFVPPNTIVSSTYSGLYLFKVKNDSTIEKIGFQKGGFEATPFVYEHKIYLASRDGNMYCWGDTTQIKVTEDEEIDLIAENEIEDKDTIEIIVDNESSLENETAQVEISDDASDKVTEVKDQDKTEVASVSEGGKYHIIIGAFGEMSNAEGKLKEMKNKGFDQAQILPPIKGLNYVSVSNHATENDANVAQKNVTQSTWIYRQK